MARVYVDDCGRTAEVLACCWSDICSATTTVPRSVLLKPNWVNGLPSDRGVTTSLEIVQHAIDFLKQQRGVERIAIGEASIDNTPQTFAALGVSRFEQQGIEVIDLSTSNRRAISIPSAKVFKNCTLPSVIFEFDLILNIPKMKTHELTVVTLGLKNFFAFLSTGGRKHAHRSNVNDAIVDIYCYLRQNIGILTLIDASVALSGKNGPIHGFAVPLNICVGSTDTLCADFVAARIMGADPWNIAHLACAAERRLGEVNSIDIVGKSIKSIGCRFELPTNLSPLKKHVLDVKNRVFRTRPILRYPAQCTGCKACMRVCPQTCVVMKERITIDYRRCIGCLCCCEACASGALLSATRLALVYRIVRKMNRLVRLFL